MPYYKHSAPLKPGADGGLRVLQTFGSAGAGWRLKVSVDVPGNVDNDDAVVATCEQSRL